MGLAIVIVLAWRFPGVAKKDGVIHSEWSIKWGKVCYSIGCGANRHGTKSYARAFDSQELLS
jgi:hypothetical protein